MEEAGELAKNTAILLNVSEFENEEQATEALISSLQAFNYEASDSIKIVDKLNIIGNNFAISSDGIAEGLSRSASTLVAAGNTLEESIAMLAAGNKVQQDPEGLGNALKVLSMRIRGTKTDLEEAGEETEGMIENTSKLRDKVMALTDVGDGGVDILTDTGAYKSTYQILLEIAKVWDQINEVDPKNQAALLEILAGKTRGSQVASILQNPEDLKDAYEMALNSDGSAQKELETYLDSIQGRIDLFTNELQTFWMNLINSDLIKWFVDAGTTILEVLNNIMDAVDKVKEGWGSLGVIIPAVAAGAGLSVFKKNNNIQNTEELFAFGKNKIKGGFSSISQEVASMFKAAASEYGKVMNNTVATTEKKFKGIDFLAELAGYDDAHGVLQMVQDLIDYKDENTEVTQSTAQAVLEQLQAEELLNNETVESILNSQLFATAQDGAAASTATFSGVVDLLKTKLSAMWAAVKGFFVANPIIAWGAVAVAAIAGIALVVDTLTTSHKEYLEKLDESTKKIEEYESSIKSLNSELKITQEKIEELEDKGVLSFTEEEELRRLRAQNNELEREIKLKEALMKREKKEQINNALGAIKKDKNFKNNYNDYPQYVDGDTTNEPAEMVNAWEATISAIESSKEEMQKAKSAYYEELNKGDKADEKLLKELKNEYEFAQQKYDANNKTFDELQADFEEKYGDVGFIENATEAWEKEWNEYYRTVQRYINDAGFINGTLGHSDIISSTFGAYGTDAAKKFKEEFEKGVAEGKDPVQFAKELASGNEEYAAIFDDLLSNYLITQEQVVRYFTQTGEVVAKTAEKAKTVVTSLDAINASIEAYKSMLGIVNSITSDGQAISEEYYNTLKEQLADITVGSQDFSDAIDAENGYIVKNASLLRQLVAQNKNIQQSTIKVAKAQAQLQYKNLIQQIRSKVIYLGAEAQAHEFVSRAMADNINVMRDHMEAIEQTIQEYALLELSLSDAANAFDEYEKAKERDAKLTYDDSMLEMLKTIDEGLLKNETGTEAFEYAVKAIVPEEFWKDIEDVDEKIRSIHDYLDGDPVFSRFFYVDEDSGDLDITADNVREFVDLCVNSGLFDGSSKDFALNNSVEGIKDFAEGLGVTEAIALAMLTALEKVDATWGNILTDITLTPFERSLNTVIRDMATLNEQFASGAINAQDYAQQMAPKEIELAKLTKEARDGLLGSDDRFDEALQHLNKTKEEALTVGYDGVQSQFGNIDTNDTNRILNWTEQSLEANKEALLSWEKETTESIDEAWARIKSEFEGSYSTVATSWDTFDGIDIAYTPMLQTDNGPVYVDANTLVNYVSTLIAKAKASGQEPTYDVLMQLDAQGLDGFEQSGYRIKGMLADVGETASRTAEIMHFAGSTGAIADAENQLDYARGYVELQKQVVAAQENVDKSLQNLTEKQKAYNNAVDSGLDSSNLEAYEEDLKKANEEFDKHTKVLDEAIKKRDELGDKYDAYAISVTIDDIDAEIEAFGDQFDEILEKKFEKDANGIWQVKAGLNLDNIRQQYPELVEYVDLLNSKTELEALLDPTKAEEEANKLKETVNNIIEAVEQNLITLELDEKAVENVVEQANKILGGIASEIGVWLDTNLSDRTKKILKLLGIDVGGATSSNTSSSVITGNYRSTAGSGTNNSRQNSIYAKGSDGLKTNEHNAVVGELGMETVVDVDKGIYYTVGENGTEIVDLPKHAIIYNHKQTEELFKTGKTSRGTPTGGLSFAKGNAHYGVPSYHPNQEDSTSFANYTRINNSWDDAISTLLDSADALSDSASSFNDAIDWIEVLFNRIDNTLSEHEARMATLVDSTGGLAAKAEIYSEVYDQLYKKASSSLEAKNFYINKAAEAMAILPVDIQNKIKNGTIDIDEFKFDKSTEGLTETQKEAVEQEQKAYEKLVEQINDAIGYYDKISEYEQQYWTTLSEIADKAQEHLEEVSQAYENEIGLVEHLNNQLESHNDLLEIRDGFGTKAYYEARIEASEIMLEQYEAELIALKAVLEAEVAAGRVKVGDQQWFDMQQAIFDVEDAIIDMEISIEELQNSINDLHWDRFDELINRFGYLEDEISNIVQLLSHDVDGLVMEELRDLTTDNWATDSGLATIGLYAQEMERAQYVAKQYAEAIEDLKKDYAAGRYNETEYLSKLNELISAQYENIEKYYDARDAIIELNEARVDAIRDGIEKEINAYQELIDKKKELLNREKDLHDFQNDIQEKEKSVADLRKQLAAMAGDDTAAGVARRKQLEEELIEAQKALEDSYYDHSMTERQNALDREFEAFEEEKNKEIEKWEEWLTETEQVVTEALDYVKENTDLVYAELTELGSQYGLTLSDTLTTPWYEGQNAIDNYSLNFEEAKSNFVDMLDEIVLHWEEVTLAAEEAARQQAAALQAEYDTTTSKVPSTNANNNSNNTQKDDKKQQEPSKPAKQPEPVKQITVGGKINAGSATIYADSYGGGGGKQYYRNDPIYVVLQERNGYLLVRHHKLSSGYTGWFKKSDVKAYAHGLGKAQKDHWAMVNELGAELQLVPGKNGNLEYVKYGTSILPHDVSAKLVDLANDPTSVFDDMKTGVKIPTIETKNFNYEFNFDSLLHVDNASNDSIPALQKMIRNEFNTMMKQVNNGLKRTGRS